jgi:tryptophanyl-tRNA synthetase
MNSLSGIKPTGQFHLGNFISVIKPVLEQDHMNKTIFLIADYHAIINNKKENIEKDRNTIAKILAAFGAKDVVYQSDFPQITELSWILNCFTSKGLMNRAHGYKAKTAENIHNNQDMDDGINMGLYSYPVLMTADLLIFGCNKVFIGLDQQQHIEMAIDIVNRMVRELDLPFFNYRVPDPTILTHFSLEGYDGRKMSKSYNNTIPLLCSKKKLKKHIFSMKTNDKRDGVPKYWDESPVCTLYNAFATDGECEVMRKEMEHGLGWGMVKQRVFDKVNSIIRDGVERVEYMDSYEIEEWVKNNRLRWDETASNRLKEIKRKLFGYI